MALGVDLLAGDGVGGMPPGEWGTSDKPSWEYEYGWGQNILDGKISKPPELFGCLHFYFRVTLQREYDKNVV